VKFGSEDDSFYIILCYVLDAAAVAWKEKLRHPTQWQQFIWERVVEVGEVTSICLKTIVICALKW